MTDFVKQMINVGMTYDDADSSIANKLGANHKLSGLQVPSNEEIKAARLQFPNLSKKYWNFVTSVGTGEAQHCGFSCCLPYLLTEESSHPSLQLYRGGDFQQLRSSFNGFSPEKLEGLPEALAVISSPGASWRYCLAVRGGDAVYTYDFGTQQTDKSYDNFFDFVTRSL